MVSCCALSALAAMRWPRVSSTRELTGCHSRLQPGQNSRRLPEVPKANSSQPRSKGARRMHFSQKMHYREAETFCENLPCRETRSGSIFVNAEGNASQGGRDAVIVVGQTRARKNFSSTFSPGRIRKSFELIFIFLRSTSRSEWVALTTHAAHEDIEAAFVFPASFFRISRSASSQS